MDSQNRSLEFALLLTLPAAVALLVAAEPIIRVLFERGAFLAADTPKTAYALMAFAAGLPAFVLIKVFQPAFFAREDTKTPMYYAGINMAVNVVASIAFFFLFQTLGLMPHVGIALATTLAAWVNAVMLFATLKRHGDFEADQRLVRNLPLIVLASLAMGGLVYVLTGWLAPQLSSAATLGAMRLSARGYTRMLRVARTIADLAGAQQISRTHVAEALSYRRQAPRA